MIRTGTGILSCFVLLLVAGGLLGCASTKGTDRADKAVATAESLRDEFKTLSGQIDTTVTALDGVVTAKGSTLRPAYDRYVTELDKLDSQAETVVSRAADLKSRTDEYIKEWEMQMADVQNPTIREHAAKRREEAEKKFESARDELERIDSDYKKFASDLREIRMVLENDLNPTGVASLESVIATAKSDADPVKKDLEGIVEGIDKIIQSLSAGTSEGTGEQE